MQSLFLGGVLDHVCQLFVCVGGCGTVVKCSLLTSVIISVCLCGPVAVVGGWDVRGARGCVHAYVLQRGDDGFRALWCVGAVRCAAAVHADVSEPQACSQEVWGAEVLCLEICDGSVSLGLFETE